MQCALKIKSVLLIILTHILLDVKAVVAIPSNRLFVKRPYADEFVGDTERWNPSVRAVREDLTTGSTSKLPAEVADFGLKAPDKPLEEEATQVAKTDLPLVKVAHRDVMDLLHLFFVPKTVHLPSYVPLVQQVGVRINWFQFLQNVWSNERKSYGGGVDLHFRGPIQLSVDFGYLDYQPKDIVYGNKINYSLKGSYGLGAILYAMDINLVTHGYFGVGYGYSRFNLMTADRDHGSTLPNPVVVGWIKLIGGSELRLMPQIYGGMGFGIAYLLHGRKNKIADLSTYIIPGYGQVGNCIVSDVTLYLKWSISLLEKKIVI